MIKLNRLNTENKFVGALNKRPSGITLISLVVTIVLNTFGVVVVNK